MKYIILVSGDDGPMLYEFDSIADVQEFFGEHKDEGDELEIKRSVSSADVALDQSGWALVIKGTVVIPKEKKVMTTQLVWEAQ